MGDFCAWWVIVAIDDDPGCSELQLKLALHSRWSPDPHRVFPTMTWILSCIANRGPLSSISLLALDQSRATEHDRPKNTGVFLSGILRVQFRSFTYLLAAGTANCRIERWPRHTTMSLGSLFFFQNDARFGLVLDHVFEMKLVCLYFIEYQECTANSRVKPKTLNPRPTHIAYVILSRRSW